VNLRPALLLAVAVLTTGCAPRTVIVGTGVADAASTVNSAGALIRAMHARYAGRWYRNLTFVQTSQYYDASGNPSRTETWYEAGRVPGTLRIDIGERSAGDGQLFRNDSAYVFQDGRQVRALRSRNPLMLLGFDVYAADPDRMLRMLAEEGFDTTTFHEATANGRRYYVVGAPAGDTTSRQFWIEADRLLFWRLIQPPPASAPDRPATEIRFQKYVQHGGGWVAEEVDFLRGGQRFFFERYADVRVDVELDPALFDPAQWTSARYWR
jgi:hypothetical protein